MKINISSITDIGLEREQNEDTCAVILPKGDSMKCEKEDFDSNYYIQLNSTGTLAIVADGMGGRNAGEVASHMLIDCFEQECTFETLNNLVKNKDSEESQKFLAKVMSDAHCSMMAHIESHHENLGMATTAAAVWLTPEDMHLAWCGDCRVYSYSPLDGLRQLSHDHSYVQQLVDEHKITIDEAFDHPEGNLVTRGLGDVDVETHADSISMKPILNSMIILCSDGLCGYVRDKEISSIVSKNFTSSSKCSQALLKSALAAGGGDNITIIVLSIIADEQSSPKLPLLLRLKIWAGLI